MLAEGQAGGTSGQTLASQLSGNGGFGLFGITFCGLSQESAMDDLMNHYECVGSAFQWVRSLSLQLCLTL